MQSEVSMRAAFAKPIPPRFQRLVAPNFRSPILERSIREENRSLLLRRWEMARLHDIDWQKSEGHHFQGQRRLLEILSVLNEDQVNALANLSNPLFTVVLPPGTDYQPSKFPECEFSKQSIRENNMVLMCRLDCLRIEPFEAKVRFDLSSSQANFLNRYASFELSVLAQDPAVKIVPAVADAYFEVAALSNLTTAQRTLLATANRLKLDRSIH